MVRDFLGGNGDQHTISKLTGVLAAVFMVAQLLTSYPWGLVSDRYGRKGLVILGNFFTTVGIVLFGLSPTYLLACAARFLGGFFNCSYM
jgi:MFS family permease